MVNLLVMDNISTITGKRHADILRAITKMLNQLEISQRTFAFTYTDEQGKLRPCYNLPKRSRRIKRI